MNNVSLRRSALFGSLALLSVAYLTFATASSVFQPSRVYANIAPSGSFGTYTIGGGSATDTLYTWDFKSTSAQSDNVDWPLRFVFKQNAEIDKVKDRVDGVAGDPGISPMLDSGGSTKYGSVHDGPEQPWWDDAWDADGGIKEGLSCAWDWGHMRLYARDSADRNYNLVWGYYVVATAHRDYEPCTPKEYNSSETSEASWNSRFNVLAGSHSWSYATTYQYFGNGNGTSYQNIADPGDWDHWYEGDGYGTSVWVP